MRSKSEGVAFMRSSLDTKSFYIQSLPLNKMGDDDSKLEALSELVNMPAKVSCVV
jgi:hypothetical protein